MNLKNVRIGLALSGGGIRAAIFHLGVLQYLAEARLLNQVASISSVSGASLCIGAIFAANNNKWPSDEEYLETVQHSVRGIILNNDIQRSALRKLPFSPSYWLNRVGLLAKMLEDKWGIKGTLQDLPSFPYWEINCTSFETGNRFRFRRDYMGDYLIGYAQKPQLPISHMIAASAGFPVLIGPYILNTEGIRWTYDKWGRGREAPVEERLSLWDGGVYDNLGLEALYKIGYGLDEEIDFLIISNASSAISFKRRKRHFSAANLARLLDIAVAQTIVLRSREVNARIIAGGEGMYIRIGHSTNTIANRAGIRAEEARAIVKSSLSPDDAIRAGEYTTTLKTPPAEDYELIFRHGYENAKATYIFTGMTREVSFV